jgi:hypothetical protein
MGTVPNANTVWVFNVDKLSEAVATEKKLRGVSYADIQRETGVGWTQIAAFCTSRGGVGIHGLVSLAMWANVDIRSLVVRKRNATRHTMTPQERELRNLAKYLEAAGLKPAAGESPAETAIRLIALAKSQGADLDEGDQ